MFGRAKPHGGIKLSQLTSLIAEGVKIDGDIDFNGGLRIDGRVHGAVTGHARDGGAPALLVLSRSGHIEGQVRCDNALIDGSVTGDIVVERFVELQPGARIRGTLRYRQLQMAVGAAVDGQLVQIEETAASHDGGKVVELAAPEPRAAGERRAG